MYNVKDNFSAKIMSMLEIYSAFLTSFTMKFVPEVFHKY